MKLMPFSGAAPRILVLGIALVLIALALYGDALAEWTRRLFASAWRVAVVFAVVLAFALPHIGLLWDFSTLGGFFAQEQPPCEAPWRGGAQRWHRCQHRLLWEHRPMPLYTVEGVSGPGAVTTAVVVAIGLLGSLVLLRGELVPAQQRQVSGATSRRASSSASS